MVSLTDIRRLLEMRPSLISLGSLLIIVWSTHTYLPSVLLDFKHIFLPLGALLISIGELRKTFSMGVNSIVYDEFKDLDSNSLIRRNEKMRYMNISRIAPAPKTPIQLESIHITLYVKHKLRNPRISRFLLKYFNFFVLVEFESKIFTMSYKIFRKWCNLTESLDEIYLNDYFENPSNFWIPITIENKAIPQKDDSLVRFKFTIKSRGGKFCKFVSCILGLLIFCSENRLRVAFNKQN